MKNQIAHHHMDPWRFEPWTQQTIPKQSQNCQEQMIKANTLFYVYIYRLYDKTNTLQGTNISPLKVAGKKIFLQV